MRQTVTTTVLLLNSFSLNVKQIKFTTYTSFSLLVKLVKNRGSAQNGNEER